MANGFFLILVLIALAIFSSLDVLAQETSAPTAAPIKKLPSFQLMTQGVPEMSMATYGMLVKEIGPGEEDKKRIFNTVVREAVASINAAKDPPLSKSPMLAYMNTALGVTSEFEKRTQGVKTAIEANQTFGVTAGGVIALGSLSGGPFTAPAGVIAGTAVGLATLATDNRLQRQLGKLEAEHSKKMGDLITVALVETREKNIALFEKIADGVGNEESAKEALNELVGTQGPILDDGFLNKLPEGSAREQGRTAMIYVLRDAIGRTRALNNTEIQKIKVGLGKTRERLLTIEEGFEQMRAETKEKFKAVEVAQKHSNEAIIELGEGLQSVALRTGQNAQDIGFMQELMWGKLSNKEKLAALDHGFMRDMYPQKRENLRKALGKAASAETLMETVDTAINYAGGGAAVLKKLGFPINQIEFNKNIQTAKAGTSVVTNLMIGNYMGALMAAGGLFGSDNSPDIGEVRHLQLMAKLDEIIELQKKILDAVNQLSRQVAQSTEQIMDKLAGLDYKMDLASTVTIGQAYEAPKLACVEFQSRAFADFEMDDKGRFPSYESRLEHFNIDQSSRGNQFRRCTEFLQSDLKRVSVTNSAHPALSTKIVEYKNAKGWQTTHWEPIVKFTHELMGTGGKKFCSSRLLGVAAQVPEQFHAVSFASLICSKETDVLSSESGIYRNSDGQVIVGYQALNDVLYFPSVRFFGEALAFFAPYYDLMQPGGVDGSRQLLTVNQLVQKNRNPSPLAKSKETTGEIWMSQYLDVINIVLAQETIYSGLFVAKETAENIIQASSFGNSTRSRDGQYEKWRERWITLEKERPIIQSNLINSGIRKIIDSVVPEPLRHGVPHNVAVYEEKIMKLREEWASDPNNNKFVGGRSGTRCESLQPGYPEGKYFAATCLMEINPFFRQNVVTFLVLRAIERSREQKLTHGTEALYRVAYYMNNPYWMEKLLPGLPVDWLDEGENREGWHLRLRKHTGETWHLPLPPPYFVQRGLVAYSPVMREAREYRDRTMKRYLFHSAHRHVNNKVVNTKAEPELKRQTLRLMQQMALYSDDTVLADFLVDPEQRPALNTKQTDFPSKVQNPQ